MLKTRSCKLQKAKDQGMCVQGHSEVAGGFTPLCNQSVRS